VTKIQASIAMKIIANVIILCSFRFPVDKILRMRNSIDRRVQVLAAAKRIWLVIESFSPIATVGG
jgi:hypothetical protein